jgi:hypothetical protein
MSLLDELDGKSLNRTHYSGYHPKVYGVVSKHDELDTMTAQLCRRCQGVDVTKYSLELQLWWRNHQEHDRRRAEAELKAAKDKAERDKVLAKLSPHERRLLGFGDS